MATATTGSVSLLAASWTLIADGDAGVTDVFVQAMETGGAWLRLATSLPGTGVTGGVVLNTVMPQFSASLWPGQKLYGRGMAKDLPVMAVLSGA